LGKSAGARRVKVEKSFLQMLIIEKFGRARSYGAGAAKAQDVMDTIMGRSAGRTSHFVMCCPERGVKKGRGGKKNCSWGAMNSNGDSYLRQLKFAPS